MFDDVLIAVGANLPSRFGGPREACEEAVRRLEETGLRVCAVSNWYETAPVPLSDQPWYVNGVARVETDLPPKQVLAILHRIEAEMGRVRTVKNAPRVIDLDLLAHGVHVVDDDLVLPHPRLSERAFVLYPLRDVAPDWRHPVTGRRAGDLIGALPPGQTIRAIPGSGRPATG